MHMHSRFGRAALFQTAGKVLLLTLLLAFLLSACRPTAAQDEPTVTAFPLQAPVHRITTAAPIPITLDNLAANPDFYIGATLQLTGQFRRLPLLVCEGQSFPSPATWGLEANGFLANAAGMDEQLRSLLDEYQTITVEGRWLKYEGPFGCEGTLQEQTIWYLSTDRVLDPHPLVRIQGTPVIETVISTEIAELPVTATEQIEQVTVTAVTQPTLAPTVTAVPTFTPDLVATAPVVTATNTLTPDPAATTVDVTATPTLSGTQTATAAADGSPTATIDAAQTATATPGATVTPSGSAPADKGNLDVEDLVIDSLGAGTTDRWELDLFAGDSITITVAPGTSESIVLSILDSNGTPIVSEQNSAAAGQVETIKNLNISNPGIHNLLIRTEQGNQTDYALMFMDSESYSFIFRGTLPENSTQGDSLAADNDHFWFFNAQSGETVSFSITPDGASDPYIELYDPGGARMITIDDTGEGEVEALDTYTLPDAGLYGIRVAEFDFRPMSYQIILTKP